jgi:hypothetical protein
MLSQAAGMPGTDGRNNSGMHGRLQRNIHRMYFSTISIFAGCAVAGARKEK